MFILDFEDEKLKKAHTTFLFSTENPTTTTTKTKKRKTEKKDDWYNSFILEMKKFQTENEEEEETKKEHKEYEEPSHKPLKINMKYVMYFLFGSFGFFIMILQCAYVRENPRGYLIGAGRATSLL